MNKKIKTTESDINKIIKEWTWRLKDPRKPDLTNAEHIYELKKALEKIGYSENVITEVLSNISELKKKT